MTAFRGLYIVYTVSIAVTLTDYPFAVLFISFAVTLADRLLAVLFILYGLTHLIATLYVVFIVNDQLIFNVINVANVYLSYYPTVALFLFLLASVILPIVF
jgi:hypothetical protein